ncbi:putative sensor domain DACNV-containing protein [Candidatus Laterigemmans baculatus]|uniref:putative sensor domain DACNV-containing protein n=1 Tax=Candidatus Laterigemmans baculatus TaxID=2770505 RepID=UPI0013DC1C51|nr:hypothetical protein [Candidatus Laterigemmans baculatus]
MDLARVISAVVAAWRPPPSDAVSEPSQEPCQDSPQDPHLDPAILSRLISTAFEASLLREENRPLTFRMIMRCPDRFPDVVGKPTALQRLPFDAMRPFTAQELRRLTPAVDHDRALVGVCVDANGELRIWGIVHSGPRWLEQFYGGRGAVLNLPDSLIIGVNDPGYLVISQGARPLCALEGGVLQDSRLNVFGSKWFPQLFAGFRQELSQLHEAAKEESGGAWADLDNNFTRMVGRQMIQRLISTIQRSRHGGTLLIVPVERADELVQPNPWIKLKYKFVGEEPRSRFRHLIVRTMNTLAAANSHLQSGQGSVGWDEYGGAVGPELAALDEAIFELAHMVATLTAVDGAVVVTRRFELLGFGGEIAGALSEVTSVARAFDPEGKTCQVEPTEDVGTRHRSVYRLCNTLHDVMGIVVSQDGGARFVRWNDSQVTYWNHSSLTPP